MSTSILTDLPPFQLTFAVPLHCQSCIDDVSKALVEVPGLQSFTPSLPSQTFTTTGTAAPSTILSAISSTGRDAILRGSGTPNSAAVAILETHEELAVGISPVRGLVRFVQVADNLTVLDVSLTGVREGKWGVSVRRTGDISLGALSTGGVWEDEGEGKEENKGWVGDIEVGKEGRGDLVTVRPFAVWEVVGRGLVVERLDGVEKEDGREVNGTQGQEDKVVGVIARSAGVWENEKTVCSCSGKTVWEEREEQKGRGML